jgi:hypothetical protein
LLEGLEGVDEAQEDEEKGNPGWSLGDEAKDGTLEEKLWTIVSVDARSDILSREGENQMGAGHSDCCYTA